MIDQDGVAAAVYNEREFFSLAFDGLANTANHLSRSVERDHITIDEAFAKIRTSIERRAKGADAMQWEAFDAAFALQPETIAQ